MSLRVTCRIPGCDRGRDGQPWTWLFPDSTALRSLLAHIDEHDQPATVTQLPNVTWHEQAMRGLLTLCRTGRPFVVSEVIALGVPDAPNPRTDWARVTNEARDAGWMVPTHRLGHSVRPTTKGSPATEWIGTAQAPARVA